VARVSNIRRDHGAWFSACVDSERPIWMDLVGMGAFRVVGTRRRGASRPRLEGCRLRSNVRFGPSVMLDECCSNLCYWLGERTSASAQQRTPIWIP
jgi:hypothetical protein